MLISAAAVRPALRRGWARRLKREARSPCSVAAAASILGFSLDSFVSLIEPALGGTQPMPQPASDLESLTQTTLAWRGGSRACLPPARLPGDEEYE